MRGGRCKATRIEKRPVSLLQIITGQDSSGAPRQGYPIKVIGSTVTIQQEIRQERWHSRLSHDGENSCWHS